MRESVRLFAEAMEAKIATHDDDRGGWGPKSTDIKDLWEWMQMEGLEALVHYANCLELRHTAVTDRRLHEEIIALREELIDIANLAMMLYDWLDGRGDDRGIKKEGIPKNVQSE